MISPIIQPSLRVAQQIIGRYADNIFTVEWPANQWIMSNRILETKWLCAYFEDAYFNRKNCWWQYSESSSFHDNYAFVYNVTNRMLNINRTCVPGGGRWQLLNPYLPWLEWKLPRELQRRQQKKCTFVWKFRVTRRYHGVAKQSVIILFYQAYSMEPFHENCSLVKNSSETESGCMATKRLHLGDNTIVLFQRSS